MQAAAEVAVASSGESPEGDRRKKVVVIGAGWAGLAAAYELSKQVCADSNFQTGEQLRAVLTCSPSLFNSRAHCCNLPR